MPHPPVQSDAGHGTGPHHALGTVKSWVEGGYKLVGREQWVIAEGIWRIEEACGSGSDEGIQQGGEERERCLGISPELLMPTAFS